jgi:VanZ family protein
LKHSRELFWHYWLPVLGMLSLIKLESTDKLSGGHTIRLVGRILAWAGIHLRGSHLELLNLVLRKCGHMVGYGLLCFCWLLLLRGSYWLQHDYKRSLRGSIQIHRMWWRQEWAALAVFLTFLVASADELHQMSIPSRTGSWWDVALDTGAGCVVLAMTWAKAQWLCRNRAA